MPEFVLGLDVGTSGVRALAVDRHGKVLGAGSAKLPPTLITGARREQHPDDWWYGLQAACRALRKQVDLSAASAVALDATSGTILPINAAGIPMEPARMYDDADTGETAQSIAILAPRESAAHGASSPAARARGWVELPGLHRIVHQADWLNLKLGSEGCVTDENNALKTGYDPVARRWPDWLEAFGLPHAILPKVVPIGTPIGKVDALAATFLSIPAGIPIAAGTTDGCATFLASGASQVGEGATALGSTLVLKLLSDRPIFAPEYGIYSHRLGDQWLAGGASNCGGRTLSSFFDDAQIAELTARIDPTRASGLDYYPLPSPGERFPIADARLAPRLHPRPSDDALFLQGMLEGLAAVEKLGYDRLAELGGPRLKAVRHAGGGARNTAWMRLRSDRLSVPLTPAWSEEAAAGAARLAWRALGQELNPR